MTNQNHQATCYRLTTDGTAQLLREASRWNGLVTAIARVMKPMASDGEP